VDVRAPKPIPAAGRAWPARLGFWLLWTLANAAGGAVGLLAGDCVLRWKLAWVLSVAVGTAVFEAAILLAKSMVFRRFRGMRHVQGLDTFAWLAAAAIIVLGSYIGERAQGEGITALSLDLVRFAGWLALTFALISHLPRFSNPEVNRRRKERFARLREYFDERPLLKPAYLPLMILGGIVLFLLAAAASSLCILAPLFIVIGPIEVIRPAVASLAWPANVICFGAAGVGWVGCVSGLLYLVPFPGGRTIWDIFRSGARAGARTGKS
jgi:hypothetical protein